MISLTCTHCKQVLKIDDAFAGGVCRCQHCGTIQTVPMNLKEGGGPVASSAGKAKSQKALYQHKSKSGTGAATQGSGLDELAQIVASSGLSGSGLTRGSLRTAKPKNAATPLAGAGQKKMLLLIGGGTGLVVVLGIVVFLVLGKSGADSSGPAGNSSPGGSSVVVKSSGNASPRATGGPSFAGMDLAGNSVVYVIDRGGGTKESFSDLLELTFKSIESLGPDRKFQIVFWDNGTDPLAYPAVSMNSATPANTAEARNKLQDAYAFGQSDYKQALGKAFARAPDAVVIATGKGFDMDDTFVKAVDTGRGGSGIKVYTLAVNGSGSSTALKQVAQKTGGAYLEMSTSELRTFNQ